MTMTNNDSVSHLLKLNYRNEFQAQHADHSEMFNILTLSSLKVIFTVSPAASNTH